MSDLNRTYRRRFHFQGLTSLAPSKRALIPYWTLRLESNMHYYKTRKVEWREISPSVAGSNPTCDHSIFVKVVLWFRGSASPVQQVSVL